MSSRLSMRSRLFAQPSAEMAAIALITALAAFLRLWQLDAIPPGLHYDEAFHSLQAREILFGNSLPVVLPGNFGALPLQAYMTSVAFRFFGQTPLAVRSVSAAAGILAVPALYLLVREVLRSPPVAALAAFLLAVSFQGVVFGREGMEANLVPLFEVLALYLLWSGWRRGGNWRFALGGLALAAGFYAYRAFWLFPVVMALAVVWLALAGAASEVDVLNSSGLPARLPHRRRRMGLAALLLVAGLLLMPLGLVSLNEGQLLGERFAQVSVANPAWSQDGPAAALLRNAAATVLMFNVQGDADPRSNLPGRPMLDVIQSMGFLAGLVVCLRGWRRPDKAVWLVWLVVMVLPSTLSDYAPHFRRAIGVLPAVTVLVALGLERLWALAGKAARALRPSSRVVAAAPSWLLGLALAATTLVTGRDYFVLLGPTNEYYYAFDTGLADMARYANSLPPADRAYYLPADNRHNTLQFLATGPVPSSFESRQVWVLPPADQRDTVYIAVSMEDPAALPFLERAFPAGRVVHQGRDREGGVYFTAYRVPAGSPRAVTPARPLSATMGAAVALLGTDIDGPRDGRLTVTVWWRCLATMDRDYTAFVHLAGPGGLVAQRDAQPGAGSFPTSRWQPGETIIDRFVLDVTRAPAGDYELLTGMYLLATLERLPVRYAAGHTLQGGAARLATLRLP